MSGSETLADWLRARLDADESQATNALSSTDNVSVAVFRSPACTAADIVFIAHHGPERVLRDVAAKRRLLDLHRLGDDPWSTTCETCMDVEPVAAGDMGGQQWPCETVRLLAQSYRGEPGWREEWDID